MVSEYKIFWTGEALHNLEDILHYLSSKWTSREIERFKKRLSRQISLIEQNPKLFPVSQLNPAFRKAVLSRQTTIFYQISGSSIYLLYLFNNSRDIESISRSRPDKL
jgi:plasmid stabilization system protein ParE